MPEEQIPPLTNIKLINWRRFKKYGMKGGINVEKAKTFIVFVLTITLFASYFMIYNLLLDNRNLKNKVNDLNSALRVHQIIEQTGKNGG